MNKIGPPWHNSHTLRLAHWPPAVSHRQRLMIHPWLTEAIRLAHAGEPHALRSRSPRISPCCPQPQRGIMFQIWCTLGRGRLLTPREGSPLLNCSHKHLGFPWRSLIDVLTAYKNWHHHWLRLNGCRLHMQRLTVLSQGQKILVRDNPAPPLHIFSPGFLPLFISLYELLGIFVYK